MTSLPIRILVPGQAAGVMRMLSKPLSLWGGYDVHTGAIIDATHPQVGLLLGGQILAMREARGSSSSSSALVEAVRCGTAPSAIILGRLDPILVIGGLVARELYDVALPVVLLGSEYWPMLSDGAAVRISTEEALLTIRD